MTPHPLLPTRFSQVAAQTSRLARVTAQVLARNGAPTANREVILTETGDVLIRTDTAAHATAIWNELRRLGDDVRLDGPTTVRVTTW